MSARYRPRLFAGRIGGTSGAEAGLHQMLPVFSALDLVQNSLRRVLADGMAGITENDHRDPPAIPFGDLGPHAVGIGTAVDQPAEARKDPGSYGFISCSTGLDLSTVELEVMSRGRFVVKFQYQADPAVARSIVIV